MSFSSLNATLSPSGLHTRSGEQFTHELAALVEDIQRTKDWFNAQMDAQLASLEQLHASMQVNGSECSSSKATLFEAPHPVVVEPSTPEPTPVRNGAKHPSIVVPPTLTATLDPQLEQITLHELNNALSLAFSEISARGGMLG